MELVAHPSESNEQQQAETILIQAISNEIKVNLVHGHPLTDETHITVDGYCVEPAIICEAWAHIGPPKSAHKQKVMTDAFKMLYIEKAVGKSFRKILVFADEDAAKPFLSNTWQAKCLRAYNIETKIVKLPQAMREKIIRAQKRQYR